MYKIYAMDMNGKDYVAILNVTGAVCSILALLLTLSQNVTFALVVEALISIAFFIGTAGVLGGYALKFNRWLYIKYWYSHLLYWLVLGLGIVFLSSLVAAVGFMSTSAILNLGLDAIEGLKSGKF